MTVANAADFSATTLAQHLAGLLNQPFLEQDHPLRWLVIQSDAATEHWIIVSYDHLIADAFVIQGLLAQVLSRYRGEDQTEISWRGKSEPDSFFSPISRWFCTAGSVARLCGQYFRLRHAHRIHEREVDTETVAVEIMESPLRMPVDHRARSKAAGIGLNDVVLGAAAKAVGIVTPKRLDAPRRRSVALSTIFSLRQSQRQRVAPLFAPQLDTHTVFVSDPDDDLLALVHECARQTRSLKRCPRFWRQSAAQSLVIRRFWPVIRLRHKATSYRKVFPICLGVSTFRVDSVLSEGHALPAIRVVRACPTGPALPAVLAPTLRGQNLELSLTYRCSCLDRDQARSLLHHPAEQIGELLERGELGFNE